jgi:hypothetical protein
LKGFFLPALNYAIKLFINEGSNEFTQKILELIKDLNNPHKISELLKNFSKPHQNFDDVNNIITELKFIFEGSHKHTPMDTFIKTIYKNLLFENGRIDKKEKDEKKLHSLIISMAKENEKNAIVKKLNLDKNLQISPNTSFLNRAELH